ncbi:hypothetical protein I550_1163 [Mycobacterium intracellulare 1956]|uniref:Uncharacterized protein n=1 Tax=Mycobacterium intracellulare 1956 TaxID=1299331 RepID=X8CQ97_MYCIT|nr:hypothetical protein I548_4140 [Mycobacterium intracellulare]EUA58031.1 hypothetical protein I550_1163 [Mycobacterium intracellulare 1956]
MSYSYDSSRDMSTARRRQCSASRAVDIDFPASRALSSQN